MTKLLTFAERDDRVGFHFAARCLRKVAVLAGECDTMPRPCFNQFNRGE